MTGRQRAGEAASDTAITAKVKSSLLADSVPGGQPARAYPLGHQDGGIGWLPRRSPQLAWSPHSTRAIGCLPSVWAQLLHHAFHYFHSIKA